MAVQKSRVIFPNRIRTCRKLNTSLTQTELARLVSVHRTYITKIEAGRVIPSSILLHDIARALGTMADMLFERDWSAERKREIIARRNPSPQNSQF